MEEPGRLPPLEPGEDPEQKPSNSKPTRRPKTTPKKTSDEKFEEQKRALQRLLVQAIKRGKEDGLTAAEVTAVEDALLVLGWLPRDLQL